MFDLGHGRFFEETAAKNPDLLQFTLERIDGTARKVLQIDIDGELIAWRTFSESFLA